MERGKKNFYTIKEVSELKNISEEDILSGIREGKIKTKLVGLRLMIPDSTLEEMIIPRTAEIIEQYIEQLHPDLVSMLQSAPKFGSAGLIITFHDSKIVKVGSKYEKTKLEDIK